MDVMDDPKAKKKALIRKRNKHDFILRKMIEDKARENERAEEEEQQKRDSLAEHFSVPGGDLDEKSAARVTEFKALMTSKKRKSRERWNRFAGTSGSGGRGL